MSIVYEKAGLSELDEICALVNSAVAYMEKQGIYQWNKFYPDRDIIKNDIINGELTVGRLAGKIVVIYTLNTLCDEQYADGKWERPEAAACVLHRLCVHPEYQKMGLGAETLANIQRQAVDMGCGYIRLDVYEKNPGAVRLYTGAGFVRVGSCTFREKTFYLMEKRVAGREI